MNRVVVLSIVALVTAAGVDALGDLTQNRPDPHPPPGARGLIVLDVATRQGDAHDHAAETLWHTCHATLDRPLTTPGIVSTGKGALPHSERFHLVTSRTIGEHESKRLHGCLEDAVTDHVQAHVVTISPARSG